MNEAPRPASITEDFAWLAALFSSALLYLFHEMGTSPIVWTDTFVDDGFVGQCLDFDRCTTIGARATLNIYHTSGYLHWRALLKWLGLGVDSTYVLLLGLNALGVALVALAARRVGGRIAGALAGLLMLASIGTATQLDAVTDVVPLPFLGAVFLLLGLSAAARPSRAMTVMLGTVAAVAASTYATCMFLGVSAVWIAARSWRGHRRETHAALAAGCFAAACLIIAPGSWVVNAQNFLAPGSLGNGRILVPTHLSQVPLALFAGCGFLAWAASSLFPWGRRLEAPAAVMLPLLVPAFVLSATGWLNPQGKYFAHILGAVSVILAVAAVAAARGLWTLALRARPSLASGAPSAETLERLAPYAAACAIALIPLADVGAAGMRAARSGRGPEPGIRVRHPALRYGDLAAFERILARERGWAWSKAYRNLKMLDTHVTPSILRWVPGWPEAGETDDLERAYAVKAPAVLLPDPLPAGAVIANTDGPDATVLVSACSWIDWRSFKVCVKSPGGAETCRPSGLAAWDMFSSGPREPVPGMPAADVMNLTRQTMLLHLPLRPRADCPREMVYMPRDPLLCPGRVAAVDGGSSGIDADGRTALLDRKGGARELVLQWELGVPACWSQYRGYPPFFVEGAPGPVKTLKSLLEAQAR